MHKGRVAVPQWPHRYPPDLEDITSAWVHWYNNHRLMHRLGRKPPAEAEAEYYAQAEAPTAPGRVA